MLEQGVRALGLLLDNRDVDAALRELPRALAAREPAADDVNHSVQVTSGRGSLPLSAAVIMARVWAIVMRLPTP